MKRVSPMCALPPDPQHPQRRMKMKGIFTGLALAFFMTLGFSEAAHAYTCSSGSSDPVPTSVPGDAIVSPGSGEGTDCIIDHPVTAGGVIQITANNGAVSTQALTATGDATIDAAGAITVAGTMQSTGGQVGINGQSTVSTQDLTGATSVSITASGNVTAGGGGTLQANGGGVGIFTPGQITVLSAIKGNSVNLNGTSLSDANAITASNGPVYMYTAAQNGGPYTIGGAISATDYVSISVKGDFSAPNITSTGGYVSVASRGTVKTGALTAGTDQQVYLSGSSVTVNGTITAPTTMVPSDNSVQVFASGTVSLGSVVSTGVAGGNNAGGMISISGGTIKLTGGKKLTANGVGTGQAGSISLFQSSNSQLTLDGAQLSANGGCSGSTCGSISVTSPAKISAVGAKFSALGLMGANGGQIVITGTNDTITLDKAILNANGGKATNAGGNGGTIQVTNGAAITVGTVQGTGTSLLATGSGKGSGGFVYLGTPQAMGLVSTAQDFHINASGGTTGLGGHVIIPNLKELDVPNAQGPLAFYLVNTFIDASAGSKVKSIGSFGGQVALNGVTCEKTFTGSAFPVYYWNCANPGNPSDTDKLVPAAAKTYYPSTLRAAQIAASNSIYVFTNVSNFSSFFKLAQPADAAGYTFAEGPYRLVNSSIFENTTFQVGGYQPLTPAQLRETTLHELGHATDSVNQYPSVSQSYITRVNDDNNQLDLAGAPCVAGGSGPFNNVIDESDQTQFCTDNGAGGLLQKQAYMGLTNSQIANRASRYFQMQTIGTVPGYVELYAQAFAYQTYVKSLPGPAQTGYAFTVTVNGLLKKQFFQCAQQAAAQIAGIAYPPPSYSCQ